MTGELRPWHIIIVVGVLVLLFGAKRLPDTARSVGRSLRIIKSETRGLAEDETRAAAARQGLDGQRSDTEPSGSDSPVWRVRDH